MAPREHIVWFEDNIAWFSSIDPADLNRPVPSCPGWTVLDVVNHLSFGLGLAYPVALSAPPDADATRIFDAVDWPTTRPSGPAALAVFSENLGSCARRFASTDPARPCWTYAGPGHAGFWFRRAAIETTLHRMDVAEALQLQPQLSDDRAEDTILETLSFALPFAAKMTDSPQGRLVAQSSCLRAPAVTGTGDRSATVTGDPIDLVNALWGRHVDRVTISGDRRLGSQWLALIETAFAGR